PSLSKEGARGWLPPLKKGAANEVSGGFARVGALAAVLLLAPAAYASTPLEYTRTTLEKARTIVASDRSHNDKLTALSDLLKTFLDTDAMGKAALADHWGKFSAAQQKEFLTLFRELFQRTYVQKLLLFEKPDFGYVGEEKADGGARVETKIITPR